LGRDADYGIIVFAAESQVPDKVGYFHEFDNDRLSVALSTEEEEDPDPGYLRIAFNWARTRVVQMYIDTDSGLDPEAIQTEVGEIEAEIDRFSTIKKKTTSIRHTANDIDSELEEIESEVKSRLTDIRTEIQSDREN
jgi:hypothetical protein